MRPSEKLIINKQFINIHQGHIVKKSFLLLIAVFIISCSLNKNDTKQINGLMIDSARLLEKHNYYYELVDFMFEWDMNTLLFHFSDDHGISIALPGYEKLAHPHAFSVDEIKDFITYADKKGIEIIPEFEVFGHTRYITDHPDYRHLYVGNRHDKIVFNAVNPLKNETHELMRSMLTKVSALFPSKYLHLGCDEVNLSGLRLNNPEKEAEIWVNYVNDMISIAHDLGKTPMIWSDHVRKDPNVADMLNKDVILVEWNYDPNYKASGLTELKEKGYKNIIMAPSISCWRNRIIPSEPQLKNVRAHAEALSIGQATGLINTIWLPMRYVQESMYYGVAYSAFLVNSNKPMNVNLFHQKFAGTCFGQTLNDGLDNFLIQWSQLHLDRHYFSAIANNDYSILDDKEKTQKLTQLRDNALKLINSSTDIQIKKNRSIFESMLLSADIVYTISEALLIVSDENIPDARRIDWITKSDKVIKRVEEDWDKGRFSDDPAKYKAKFPNQENSHLLITLRKLSQNLQDK